MAARRLAGKGIEEAQKDSVMVTQLRSSARFALGDEAGFQRHLGREPCTVALFAGRQCPYSQRFLTAFEEAARGDEAWSFVIRDCRTSSVGEARERHRVDVTPTVIAYKNGVEWRRLEGKPLVGIAPHRFQDWLDGLDEISPGIPR